MKIKGKIVLLTGGSSGIGRSIAKSLLEKGANLIVFGLNKPDYKVKFYKVDISKENEIIGALKKIPEVDIVINNAGISRVLSVKNTSTLLLNEIIDTNFKGAFWMCRYILPKLKKGSCIINISSIAGIKSFSDYSAYCASKSALISFTKSLALELSDKKIRANAVAPGLVDTPIFSKMFKSEREKKEKIKEWVGGIPIKRIGKPQEISHAVLFLIENDFVNGIVLPVDGGESAT